MPSRKIFEQTTFRRQSELNYHQAQVMQHVNRKWRPLSGQYSADNLRLHVTHLRSKKPQRRIRCTVVHHAALRLAGRRIIAVNSTTTTMCCQKYRLLQASKTFPWTHRLMKFCRRMYLNYKSYTDNMYFDYKILLYMYNVPSQQQKAILRPFFQVQLCDQVVSHRRDLLE